MAGTARERRARAGARVVVSLALLLAGLTVAPPRASALALVPVAVDDTATVVHGRTRTVAAPGVLANDLQLGTGFTVDLVSGPSHGDLDLSANGGYAFQADDDYVGADQFRYRVDGGLLGLSNVATVRITITNKAPVAVDDAYGAKPDVEIDIPPPGLLKNDDDPDGDDLTVDIVDEPEGNLNERDDGSFRFKADDDFTGTDTFTYRVWDGFTWSAPATVTIIVTAPTPTPTPVPTAAPTTAPTAQPTAAPSAAPSASATARPTTRPGPSATATSVVPPSSGPGASPSATATARASGVAGSTPSAPGTSAEPSAAPASTDSAGGAAIGAVGGSPAPSSRPGGDGPSPPRAEPFVVTAATDPSTVELDASQVAFGGFEWTVPAVILTVPGLLLLLGVLTQAVVGILFVPTTRRSMASDRRRRRRRPMRG